MSSYTYYDPNQALEQSRQRRQMAMQRLMQMQQAKQAYTNEQQRLLEKQQKEMEAAQNKRVENESSLGWGGGKGMLADTLIGGLSGAAMGFAASGFNPMGAAGGAVAGALTGGYKGFTERDEAKDYGKFMQPYSGPSPMAMGQVGGIGTTKFMTSTPGADYAAEMNAKYHDEAQGLEQNPYDKQRFKYKSFYGDGK